MPTLNYIPGGLATMSMLRFNKFLYALFLLLPATVYADDYHYVNHLIGERAAGMAGAYTAISDNAAGCYYNPAGIVYSIGSNFSASVNAYNLHTKTYKDALEDTNGSKKDWEKESSVILPNFFGTVYDTGSFKVGFSYAVPDATLREQDQRFDNIQPSDAVVSALGVDAYIDNYTININDVDKTYLFGPSFAKKLNDNSSIGLTMYGYYRNRTEINNQHFTIYDPSAGVYDDNWSNTYYYLTEYGIKPVIGYMFSPADKLSIGVTYSRLFVLDSTSKLQTTYQGPELLSPPLAINSSFKTTSKDTETHNNPDVVTLGIGYFHDASLLFSADIRYYHANESFFEDVINVAFGTEYYLNETYAIRAGLYTDYTNTPDISSNKVNQPEHVDIYGVTFDITRFTRNTSATLGLGYSTGSGDAQVKTNNPAIQDLEISSFTAYLSAAYNF